MREACVGAGMWSVLSPQLVADYLAAIRGKSVEPPLPGTAAPPLVGVVAAQGAARRAVVDLVAETGAAGVLQIGYTGELRRTIEVGEALWAGARVDVGRTTPLGAFAELHVSLKAADLEPVGGFRATLVLFTSDHVDRARDMSLFDRRREMQPSSNEDERTAFTLDAEAVRRYAAVSGDDNPVHLDDAAAKTLGLPSTIVHGMLVLATAVDRVIASLSADAVARIRVVGARFTTPVLTGEPVTLTWAHRDGTPGETLAFKAWTASGVAMKSGVVELATGACAHGGKSE